MKPSLPLLGLLTVGALPFVLARHAGSTADAAPTAVRTLAPAAATSGCKPDAPVRLDVFPRDLVGGDARVDYELTPVMDALDLQVDLVLPQGGKVRWHNAPPRGAAPRRSVLSGALAADLPANLPGVELEIHARISIPDPDAPDGVGIYTTVRTVTWGEVERIVSGVTEVTTDGRTTLDTAATRR